MLLTILQDTAGVTQTAQEAVMLDDRDDVDSAGVGFGTKLTYDAFSLVATGFYAHGLGIRGQRALPRTNKWWCCMLLVLLMTLVKKEKLTVVISKVRLISVKVLQLVTLMVVTT